MQPHHAISMQVGWLVLFLLQSRHAHLLLFVFAKLNPSGGGCSSVRRNDIVKMQYVIVVLI